MVILTGCTWGCLSLWERPRLSWQQQLSHLHRPAGLRWVPPSPKPASFHSGCAIPDRWQPLSAGWREGAWAAALSCPSALLPAQGSWQSGEPRADEQAVCGQSSPLGSLGTGGGPVMPVLAAEEVQLNPPPLWLLEGEEEERAKKVMKTKAGGCCLWEEGLARVKAKGCWLLGASHTLTDSFNDL